MERAVECSKYLCKVYCGGWEVPPHMNDRLHASQLIIINLQGWGSGYLFTGLVVVRSILRNVTHEASIAMSGLEPRKHMAGKKDVCD